VRYSILFFLLLLVAAASCKKPKKGHWSLTFNDKSGAMLSTFTCEQHKYDKDFDHDGSFVFSPLPGLPLLGTKIFYDGNTLSGDHIETYQSLNANYPDVYSNIKGTVKRKEGSGTFDYEVYRTYTSPGGNQFDSLFTGNGTFRLEWTSRN
jgi:hypothetical protein